jgi:hypothetical protein
MKVGHISTMISNQSLGTTHRERHLKLLEPRTAKQWNWKSKYVRRQFKDPELDIIIDETNVYAQE